MARNKRFAFSLIFALLTAGVTLAAVSAQTSGPTEAVEPTEAV